jgi:hypothetical protein
MIEDRTTSYKRVSAEKKGNYVERTCLKHCYRGNAYKGVLWTVWEVKKVTADGETTNRYIGCDILQYYKYDGWGYKDLEESSGPGYLSCPLSYLEMVPEPKSAYAKQWRQAVRERHEKRARKISKGFTYKAANGTVLGKGKNKTKVLTIKVLSLRPMRGVITCENGRKLTVKFTKACIGDEIIPMPMWKNK